MKECVKCKRSKSLDEFNKNKRRPDGLDNMCRSCRKAYYKAYYESSDKERTRLAGNRKINKDRVNDLIRERKSKPCADCEETYPYYVMQFDHMPGTKKLFNIGAEKYQHTYNKVIREIEKCEVVCANCHAIRTWERVYGVFI
jgi:hypothetical protein